ncbi:hypothetical protein LX64_05177 [Chitinophaga skermanii]|uniref:Type IX secretion system protein PorV domain-containing protein n=1 Tax=Chitinophaga skermanii TaxID=331697 RepID=A0A327PZR0_9BACT|nr:PorV/PorQ family protein [Chitinophaga skermanii]RAI96997.1 hypothetical protein LX64_05177 [Chitinophaga skermanii]
MKNLFTLLLWFSVVHVNAQNPAPALGFLGIEPDARGSALGLCGTSTLPDVSSVFYNPAKVAAVPSEYGFSANYVPYMRQLASGMGLASLQGFRRMDDVTAIGLDVRFFSLGKIEFKDETGYDIYTYNPSEWCIGITYSRLLSNYSFIGFTARYINSRPAAGIEAQGSEVKIANAIAADLGYYYSSVAREDMESFNGGFVRFGASFLNIGTRVRYQQNVTGALQPMCLRIGSGYSYKTEGNEHAISLDIEILKPLLPEDSNNRTVPSAIVAGLGYFKAWEAGAGVEYLYQNRFFLRGGVHYGNTLLSTRQLATFGTGFQSGLFNCSVSYYAALPGKNLNYNSQTFKISLGLNFTE